MISFFEKNRFWLRCWASVWCILTLVFSFYMATFFFGNHDYRFMRYGVSLASGAWEGRFTQFVLPYLLFDGHVLPIVSVFIGFAFFAAAVVLLARWYALSENYLTVVLFALIIVLNPYLLSQLYYVHSIVSILVWPLCCLGGVMLIDKGVIEKKWWVLFWGCLCLFLGFCGYGGTLEFVLTVLGGKLLMEMAKPKGRFYFVVRRYFPMGFVVLVMMLLFAGMMTYFKSKHWVDTGMYNVQTLPIRDVFLRFSGRFIWPWKVLLTPPPYCSLVVSWCVAGLMGMLLMESVIERRFWRISCGVVVWVLGMFMLAFVSPYNFFLTFRIHFFSVPYFAAVIYALLLRSGRLVIRNVTVVFGVILLFCYVRADFMAQKVWALGNKQDEAVAERVRQDLLPRLVEGKRYRASILGGFYGNQKFSGVDKMTDEHREFYREFYGYPLYLNVFFSGGFFLYESINPIWGDGLFLNEKIFYAFYNEMTEEKDDLHARIFIQSFGDDKKEQAEAAKRLKPWPHLDYFFVGQKDIFLMLGEDDHHKRILQRQIYEN